MSGKGEATALRKALRRLASDKHGLEQEHTQLRDSILSFTAFVEPENASRNRYANLLLYDVSRVILKDDGLGGDYMHASWIDGFERPAQYIVCQAPFSDETELDVWRLVLQRRPGVLVLLCGIDERGASLIQNFWPTSGKERSYGDGALVVTTMDVQEGVESDVYDVRIGRKASAREPHRMQLVHFRGWTDEREVPAALLGQLTAAKLAVTAAERWRANAASSGSGSGSADPPPQLIMCPTGVHRCGTYVALDIIVSRLTELRRVDLFGTVRLVRHNRYGCMQLLNHYLWLTETTVQYAIQTNMVHAADLPNAPINWALRSSATSVSSTSRASRKKDRKR